VAPYDAGDRRYWTPGGRFTAPMESPPLRGVAATFRARLEACPDPAILLSPDYVILAANRAYEAHYGASVRPGRDRCFEVSHGYASPCDQNGESCPLAESRRQRRHSRVFHVHAGPDGPEHVDVAMHPLFEDDEEGPIAAYLEVIRVVPEVSAQASGTFVGRSKAFQRVVELLRRVAPSDTPALLLGESGTGKELAARALHDAGPRRSGPFVPLECSGLSETLFESELFGHKKGAFTGATADRVGLVEAARGGTLFLDEIGDVPLNLQVKLLRLLETGRYRRVGESQARQADFRLVCATHRDLDGAMAEGSFRRDLYYRISAFPIELPPLRERADDVVLLAEALLTAGRSSKRLSPEAERLLTAYRFPGNVRELRNLLDRACLLADGPVLEPRHFPRHLTPAPAAASPAPEGRAAPDWALGEHHPPPGRGRAPLPHVGRRPLRRRPQGPG
jgi:two-component system response regulator HydG